MIRLPWWLNPWREVSRCDRENDQLYARLSSMAETSRMDIQTIRQHEQTIEQQRSALNEISGELVRNRTLVDSLRGQLAAAVTDSRTSGSALSTAMPEFVLVGIPRGPGMGKRLMASRDVKVTAFAMTEMNDPPPRWKLGAVLEQLLVIDKPSYGEALEHMATIWRNWDAAAREESWNPVAIESGGQLPAPGVAPAGDAKAVDGQAGEGEAEQAEVLPVGHPASEAADAGDDSEDDRSEGEHAPEAAQEG